MNEFPEVKTKRLVLRDFRPADAPAVFDINSHDRGQWGHHNPDLKEVFSLCKSLSILHA